MIYTNKDGAFIGSWLTISRGILSRKQIIENVFKENRSDFKRFFPPLDSWLVSSWSLISSWKAWLHYLTTVIRRGGAPFCCKLKETCSFYVFGRIIRKATNTDRCGRYGVVALRRHSVTAVAIAPFSSIFLFLILSKNQKTVTLEPVWQRRVCIN